MTVLAFDSSFAPTARPRQRRPWWAFWRRPPPPKPAPRRTSDLDDIPAWLRRERPRAADVLPIPGRAYMGRQPAPLTDYARKPEPEMEAPPEPVAEPPAVLDPLADVKFKLRNLAYGDFIEAVEGMGCDPKTAWKWATT